MQNKRLDQLREFLLSTPDDPFLKYAIATEYLSAENLEKALEWYNRVFLEHSDYVANYYHYGKLLFETGSEEEAKMVFEKGMEMAKVAGEAKNLREMKELYEDLFE